jgi:toluene monooxygenase system ferredoxin subunit
MTRHQVAAADKVWSGEMISAVAGRVRVLVVNVDDEVRAYEDRCAHQGVRLSEGRLEGTKLTCRAHGWEYDVRTGRGINPCSAHLRPLPVFVEGGSIFVEVEEEP